MFSFNNEDYDIAYGDMRTGGYSLFGSEAEMLQLFTQLGLSKEKVTQVWNTFAGTPEFSDCKPLKCFRNRPYAVAAIWRSIQRLIPMEDRIPANEPPDPPATESAVDAMLDVEMRKPGEMSAIAAANASALPETISKPDGTTVDAGSLDGDNTDYEVAQVDSPAEPRDPEDMTNAKKLGLTARVSEAVAGIGKKTREKAKHSATRPQAKTAKAKEGKTAKKAAGAPKAKGSGKHRDGTKREQLIALMKRKDGVSVEEGMSALGWLRHTLRGALSTMKSKGVKFTTERDGKRGHVYKAVA